MLLGSVCKRQFASLRAWISENCEEFREMQIVRHAKCVGTMIGPMDTSIDGGFSLIDHASGFVELH